MNALFAQQPDGRGDTGTGNGNVQAAKGARGHIHGYLHLCFVGHVGLHEADVSAQLRRQGGTTFGVEVSDDDMGAVGVETANGGFT